MRTAGYHVVGCALALLLSPLASKSQTQTAAQTRTPAQTQTQAPSTTPKIGDFVLYAERSIRFGHRSHTEHGDVGVRPCSTAAGRARQVRPGAFAVNFDGKRHRGGTNLD